MLSYNVKHSQLGKLGCCNDLNGATGHQIERCLRLREAGEAPDRPGPSEGARVAVESAGDERARRLELCFVGIEARERGESI